MILAAGLGTRLRPLTNNKPKALVEVNGMPLLEIVIKRLKYFGCSNIIINVHHFADQIEAFLLKNNHFDINIQISDERQKLLETGGGLKKASWFFENGEPFLLCNTDILTDLDLTALYEAHLAKPNALATLAVSNRSTSRYLIFDKKGIMNGWLNIKTGEMKMPRKGAEELELKAFSGIHVISPKIFDLMPAAESPFSIIKTYLETAEKFELFAYPHEARWLDVGRKSNLEEAQELLKTIELED